MHLILEFRPYVAVTNYGDENFESICPLIGSSEQCIDMGWDKVNGHDGASLVSVANIELSNNYKGWGLENITLSASELTILRGGDYRKMST